MFVCIIQMYKLKPYGSISEKEPTIKLEFTSNWQEG